MARKNTGLAGALQGAKKAKQKTKPKGIYLSVDERDELENILDNFGADWNLHKLIKFAISQFIDDYKSGRIKETEKTKTITELKAKK
jgi:hypothetical protein